MELLHKENILGTNGMTVGDLLKFIEERNIPMDAKVMIQRVEDRYFEGVDISGMQDSEGNIHPEGTITTGWGVYLKKGYSYYEAEQMNINMNEEIDRRSKGDEPNYPEMENPHEFLINLEDSRLLEQYHPAWSPVFYADDQDLLFIDLHY